MEEQPKASLPSLARAGIAIVLLHLLVVIAHSAAHLNLHIEMNAWQSVYILLIILVLPLIAAILVWKRMKAGLLILFASMLGSLLFGGYYHFIAAGADNVAYLGSHTWAPAFQVTGVLLALTEAAGVIAGLMGLRRRQRAKS